MWIMTADGFISVVEKPLEFGGPPILLARGRDRESLVRLFGDASRIIENKGTDYPFRVITDRDEVKRIAARAIDDINYRNFKDEAKKRRGPEYAHALMGVWTAMLRLEPRDALKYVGHGSWRQPKPASHWYNRGAQPTQAVGRRRKKKKGKRTEYRSYDEYALDNGYAEPAGETWASRLYSADELLPPPDPEVDDAVDAVERAIAASGKSLHDMTDDEWMAFAEAEGL